jgi:phosphatidylglycerophosphate synthase
MTQTADADRRRTNVLKRAEFSAIQFFCRHMPAWMTPNGLTIVGLAGGAMVLAGLWLASLNVLFVLLSIFGLAVHWFGDSLDGRLAYYRNTPRKWFGFCLDIVADWVSVFAMGLGCYLYLPRHRFIPFLLVAAYGASIIIALLRYRISEEYRIDLFRFGPTEMRLIISAVFVLEIFLSGSIMAFCGIATITLAGMNVVDLRNLLHLADARDLSEKIAKLR